MIVSLTISIRRLRGVLFLTIYNVLVVSRRNVVILSLIVLRGYGVRGKVVGSRSCGRRSRTSYGSRGNRGGALFVARGVSRKQFPKGTRVLPSGTSPFGGSPFSFFQYEQPRRKYQHLYRNSYAKGGYNARDASRYYSKDSRYVLWLVVRLRIVTGVPVRSSVHLSGSGQGGLFSRGCSYSASTCYDRGYMTRVLKYGKFFSMS